VRYRLAVFDFDGTLAETFAWCLGAVNRLTDTHGFNRIEAGDLDALRGSSARRVVAHLGIPGWKLPRIGIDMRRLMAADIGQIRLFDGIGAMLRALSDRGVALAVVTSNACDTVRPGEAIVIGDELRDLEAARAEGLPFGAVAWGYTRVEALTAQAPAAVCTAPADVVEKVAGRPPSDV
jgi:phosphoglycolate phosphatase